MQSSSQPPKPRRFDATKRSVPKPHTPALPKEDKNMNTIPNPATRRVTKAPVASPRTRVGAQPRAPLYQPKAIAQKPASANFKAVKPKFKSTRVSAASRLSPSPAPPALPSLLPLDPNCNEPSLPCLCCDGRSPQDNNSMFNHNHNNNNTISLRQQMQLPAPPGPLFQKQEEMRAKEEQPELASEEPQKDNAGSAAASLENNNESNDELDISNNAIKVDEDEDDDSSGDIDIDEEEEPDHYGDDEDDDDDTLVPSCCDCPPSLLDFSLTSSTSSSSTSISSCSDLDSDSADHSYSMSSSNDQDNMSFMLSPKVCSPLKAPESKPPARSLPSLPPSHNPFYLTSASPSSPDEGYPSALDSPDYLGIKEDSEMKLSLLDFLESVGEFGKMERFSQVIQVARWDLEGEQHWDVLRDRIDHLDRLEKVNREVKLAYIAKLHEKGFDLSDLEEQDLSDIMDEMGNIDIPWKLYKNPKGKMQDSQEFSDAGVDLTAPSDCEDPLAPDSLTPSPIEAPPKPPVRHASVTSDLHTYINISREPTSVASSPTPLSTFSLHTTSPTFTTFRCERSTPVTPPSVPPLPVSKPVPYLTLYTAPSPTIPTPTPPIPPPRTRHLARKEAQRRAALLAEQEKSPDSLPPPTTRPPPLPPPPVISISSSSPPAIPPPPALPPPPSFHALDVEIRKLLMLAGLTQAELLKISPELGNCVGGLEDEEDNIMSRCNYTIEDREEDKQSDNGLIDSLCYRSILEGKSEDSENKEERKETQKTTSFSEMARRRRRNTAYMSAPYYSTGPSSTNNSKEDDFEMLRYSSQRPSSPPPPPPPRPLPPIPSSAPPKMSTLQANSARPERFDWLIAFTPDADAPSKAPHFELRKRAVENTKKSNSSSSESSTSSSAPKITTFKELRNRKSSSPLTKFITDPEPDPSIITPDPDLLYNLKWRRDKVGDGTQWEYTSQAQALFMQPPPALTSMAALQEMLQRAEEESGKSKLCPSQNKLGYSVSDSSLWNLGTQWEHDNGKIEESGEGEVEVRGQADGERTAELLRTSASSPLPPLARSSLPYFLHSADQSLFPNVNNPFLDARPHTPVGRSEAAENPPHMGRWDDAPGPARVYRREFGAGTIAGSPDGFGVNSICDYRDCELESTRLAHKHTSVESVCDSDSLHCGDSLKESTQSTPAAPTPYKNIDVVMKYSSKSGESGKQHILRIDKASKELPPVPAFYLYHPKNCPLHRGAPPRLSPIGALSPPQRSGFPPPGAPQSGLSSPLFPRSHTLPALAAPLYYPSLYPPVPPRATPPLPPKLYQEPRHVATVRSVSFAGSVHRGEAWMARDVRPPVRGLGLSPQCLQEKRALVSAVSVAVEAIVAQFSTSRTIVQKALSGDSTVNPSLGRLVLQCLCPALHSLLTDGLKPHQSDLIAGRRPNSAWSLVQASTRPGSKTQALFTLQARVGDLPQLKQSKHRFNAFILGLLNIKSLDFWLSHLHTSSDVLETYYHPSSFMRLSLSACHSHFEELLLVLQPLGLLTFNLDLLFQHHHVDPHSPKIPGAASHDAAPHATNQPGETKKPEDKYMESLSEEDIGSGERGGGSASHPKTESSTATDEDLLETSPQLRWVKEKEISSLPLPDIDEDSLAQQAGQVMQQGWEVMVRWGGRLSQNLSELSLAAAKKDELKTEHLQRHSDFVPVNSSSSSDGSSGGSSSSSSSGVVQMPWGLDRLFGAPKSLTSPCTHPAPARRPSQWLAPGVSVLTRMVSSSTAPMLKKVSEPPEETSAEPREEAEAEEMKDQPRPLRSVRTLCDHRGSGSELSFSKGEELQVLGGVDQDWIRCRRGNAVGLVPIGYASLIV